MAGLLDGSLRHVGLAVRKLREEGAGETEALLVNLESANAALAQMAELLHNWQAEKGGRGARGLFCQRVTLGEAVGRACALEEPLAEAMGVELSLEVDERVYGLPAGPIFTAAANALRNALEAVARGHGVAVNVSVVQDGTDVVLRVTDDGPGLDAAVVDDRGRLKFGSTTKEGHGHGIGLRLVREIAQSLGGTVTVNDREPTGVEVVVRCTIEALMRAE